MIFPSLFIDNYGIITIVILGLFYFYSQKKPQSSLTWALVWYSLIYSFIIFKSYFDIGLIYIITIASVMLIVN